MLFYKGCFCSVASRTDRRLKTLATSSGGFSQVLSVSCDWSGTYFMRSMPGQFGWIANGAPYPGRGASAPGCHELSAHAPDRSKLV